MSSSSTVVPLRQPDTVDDPLTAVLRDGARRLLAQAVEAEAEAFLATMREVLSMADEFSPEVANENSPLRYGLVATVSAGRPDIGNVG